jgi:hypothetical protein
MVGRLMKSSHKSVRNTNRLDREDNFPVNAAAAATELSPSVATNGGSSSMTYEAKVILAWDLPPFDDAADCPKCASGAVRVLFHSHFAGDFPCRTSSRWLMDEHLFRVCVRCGYSGGARPSLTLSPTADPNFGRPETAKGWLTADARFDAV